MKRYFALGVVSTLAALVLLGMALIELGLIPVTADAKPSALETWLADQARTASTRRAAPPGANPVALNEANLKAGMGSFNDNCFGCHGNGDTSYYPPVPKFDREFHMADGELFYTIKHGIRLTAMPSFGSLKDEEIWQIALFLKNMEHLPEPLQKAWKAGS